jgi:hypothetical protein
MFSHGGPGMFACTKCSVVVRHNTSDPDKKIQEEIYVRIINDHEYHLIIDYGTSKCTLYEWLGGDPTRRSQRKVLIATDNMITCSPQTVDNKIKTYLLFL